ILKQRRRAGAGQPQAARPDAADPRQRNHRQGAQARRPGDLRIHGVSRRHRRRLRAGAGAGLGPAVQRGLLRRLQPRAHQPGRQGTPRQHDQEGHLRLHARSRRAGRPAVPADHHRRHAQGVQHPRGRGRQGDREHPARREHRADQRAGPDLQPAGHRHPGRAGRGGHQVELPAVPTGPGWRPLHRRGSVLPDPQGAVHRLPPRDHPGGPPPERLDGRLRGVAAGQGDDQAPHPRAGRARAGDGPDLQGKLPRPAQHPHRGHREGTGRLQRGRGRLRPVGRPRGGRARIRPDAGGPARGRQVRRRDPGGGAQPVQGHGRGRDPQAGQGAAHPVRPEIRVVARRIRS
uniref:3-oxoacyl-[acyl-carrier-protein] reductase n=1 Tax=Parastrongyloides trichosuri TaxID=131310 RepID=A0A0N4ZL21_PARTI